MIELGRGCLLRNSMLAPWVLQRLSVLCEICIVEGGLSQVSLMSFRTDLLKVKLSGGDLSWLMSSTLGPPLVTVVLQY